MTLGERIKKVRKAFDLTQQEFADRVGMKQNSIALIEGGRNTSDQTIILICREFYVSEEWLRTGNGEMFLPSPEESVDDLIKHHGLDDLDKQIITEFIKLSAADREAVKTYVRNLAKRIPKTIEQEADEFAAMARERFLAEKKQESQASSVNESGVG